MRCLYCYRELMAGEKDYHPACAKKMFGSTEVPELPYDHSQVRQLAKSVNPYADNRSGSASETVDGHPAC